MLGRDVLDALRRAGVPDHAVTGVDRSTLDITDPAAVDAVAEVIERIGYDTVRLDGLRAGRLLEPGGPVFGASLNRTDFELAMHAEAA